MKIISGGQTGVDRGALDAAYDLKFDTGGWCPSGRKSEDGPIDGKYELKETRTENYEERTRLNVTDSDGTLILHFGQLEGGTLKTKEFASEQEKPVYEVDLSKEIDKDSVLTWIFRKQIHTLNVAGPRESEEKGIYSKSYKFIFEILKQINMYGAGCDFDDYA